ncbi:MAG: hypothetical protein MZV64_41990 [Ignavibacteriales bacterium]|nr:hypothetical protein [Ignavibacteriales bacterium]
MMQMHHHQIPLQELMKLKKAILHFYISPHLKNICQSTSASAIISETMISIKHEMIFLILKLTAPEKAFAAVIS